MKTIALFLTVFSSVLYSWSQDCRKASIYFNSNKHEAKKQALHVVDSVLNRLHADTIYLIEIHGHTDIRGSADNNKQLAKERIDFIADYISKSATYPKIRIFKRNFGEENPGSDENKLNRRVDIFVKALNNDGSITVEEPSGLKMNIDYSYFRGCGYCLSEVNLKSEESAVFDNALTHIRIQNNCDSLPERTCYSAEFRFPYEQFNEPSKIKVPKMIWVNRCEEEDTLITTVISGDSLYNAGFTTRFDHTTNEYVITHKCFNPTVDFFICERSFQCYDSLRLHLTDTIINKRSAYHYTYYDFASKKEKDSTVRLPDNNYVLRNICPEIDHEFIGLGYKNGELLFAYKPIGKTSKIPRYDYLGFFSWYERYLFEADYKPLEYLQSKVRVKLPRKLKNAEVGFYIEGLDYFVPFSTANGNVFINQNLNFPYSFGIKQGDEVTSVTYTIPKKKYNRKRKVLKVKIKAKDLENVH